VRVRIRKPLEGIVDGVSLGHLRPGATYDMDAKLGGYLVTVGAADSVPSSDVALVIPLGGVEDFNRPLGGVSVTQIAEAPDRSKRTRTRKRKKRNRDGKQAVRGR
jgi:hypothetical protein